MSGAATESTDLDAIAGDIAALKRDLAALMAHVRSGGIAGAARQVSGQIGEEAGEFYAKLAAEGERAARAIGRHVDERPLASILLAFSAGFLAGRLTSR